MSEIKQLSTNAFLIKGSLSLLSDVNELPKSLVGIPLSEIQDLSIKEFPSRYKMLLNTFGGGSDSDV